MRIIIAIILALPELLLILPLTLAKIVLFIAYPVMQKEIVKHAVKLETIVYCLRLDLFAYLW